MHIVFLVVLFLIYYVTGGDSSIYNNDKRKTQVLLMGLVMFLFAALRSYTVGQDVQAYFSAYSTCASLTSLNEVFAMYLGRDPVFHGLLYFMSKISPDPQLILVVVGAVVALGFSYFTYHEKGNVLLFFMLFISLRIYSFTLSGLRQSVAIGLILIAYILLKEKRIVLYLILTFVASLFHISAIIFLIALPIVKLKKTGILIVSVLVLTGLNIFTDGAITSFAAKFFFQDRFSGYLARSDEKEFEVSITFFVYLFVYVLALFGIKSINKDNQTFYQDFNVLTIGIFLSLLSQSMDNLFRIAYYFIFALLPIFSKLIMSIFKNRNTSGMVHFIVSLLLAFQYIILGTSAGTQDYHFFWEIPY